MDIVLGALIVELIVFCTLWQLERVKRSRLQASENTLTVVNRFREFTMQHRRFPVTLDEFCDYTLVNPFTGKLEPVMDGMLDSRLFDDSERRRLAGRTVYAFNPQMGTGRVYVLNRDSIAPDLSVILLTQPAATVERLRNRPTSTNPTEAAW